eukprot:31548-Pelagococcus_subviridis.AAC.3
MIASARGKKDYWSASPLATNVAPFHARALARPPPTSSNAHRIPDTPPRSNAATPAHRARAVPPRRSRGEISFHSLTVVV